MKISVITITFNSAGWILRNINSVNEQVFPEIEQIFVDNASSDSTISLIQSHSKRNYKTVSEKDRGISDAFNKGIAIASGDVIAILNSDDEFYDNTSLSRVAEIFKLNPEVEYVFGDIRFIDSTYGSNIRRPLQCPLTHAMPFNHPAFFVRKSFYKKFGVFDLSYRYAMDFELISRMYQTSDHPNLLGHYINYPLVTMYAGGESWNYEMRALNEVKRVLQNKGFYNFDAKIHFFSRMFRIKLKSILTRLNLNGLIVAWRKLKWKN